MLYYSLVSVCGGRGIGACVRVGVGAQVLACVCARVAVLTQHAMRRYIAICGQSVSTQMFDIIT